MCQSGRMGLTRNQVCPQGHQRFESSHLRLCPLKRTSADAVRQVCESGIRLAEASYGGRSPQVDREGEF